MVSTYAGHTLDEIRESAAASLSQSDATGEAEWYDADTMRCIDPIGGDAIHIATANPATVLALVERIEALEFQREEFLSAMIEARHTLQFENDNHGGKICDTIWMMHGPETLFDFMDDAISHVKGSE